jgi:Prokaryotic E2 family E/Multiubiquitin
MEHEQSGPEKAETEIVIIEIVELEEHAKHHHDQPAPHAKRYAFRVDKERVVVVTPSITGDAILGKVGKTSGEFKLYQHKRGHQPNLIAPDHVVNLREPGVERFTTMPKDTTEGRSPCLRQDFHLPESDETYLNGLSLSWEAVLESGSRWLIIHDWKIPAGYNHEQVTLALLIPDNYLDSQIEMVYFKQHLARADGRLIGALSTQQIGGVEWQRWSRHRTGANPWRIGTDDVASHLALVDEWLCREFAKAV